MSERSKFWLSHLSAIEAEGITTKAYAEREGLSPQGKRSASGVVATQRALRYPSATEPFRSAASTAEA